MVHLGGRARYLLVLSYELSKNLEISWSIWKIPFFFNILLGTLARYTFGITVVVVSRGLGREGVSRILLHDESRATFYSSINPGDRIIAQGSRDDLALNRLSSPTLAGSSPMILKDAKRRVRWSLEHALIDLK